MRKWRPRHVVLDPVMVATSGAALIADEAVDVLVRELFPLATLVTPNMQEAARLTGGTVAGSDAQMVAQARAILALRRKGRAAEGRPCHRPAEPRPAA